MDPKVRHTATYVLALSLFFLGFAILFFAIKFTQLGQQIPEILARIERTSEKIEPVVKEVGRLRDLVPPLLSEFKQTRELVPKILEESQNIRATVPQVVEEISQIRKQIPSVLKEAEATRNRVHDVLATIDEASEAIEQASKELDAIRPLIPGILAEMKTTREEISPALDRADALLDKARTVQKEARESAVSGVISGALKSPLKILGGIGEKILGLKKSKKKLDGDNFSLLDQAKGKLNELDQLGQAEEWENKERGFRAKLTLTEIMTHQESECRKFNLKVWNGQKLNQERDITACKSDDGLWQFQK